MRLDGLESDNADLRARVDELESANAALTDRVAELEGLLDGVSRIRQGDEPGAVPDTLRLTGMNLQLVNGTGSTDGDPNGRGNLIIGYNAQRPTGVDESAQRTGSHYLVVGDQHEWTSYGGLLAGLRNTASAAGASVPGGQANTASGVEAVVAGGTDNVADHIGASVSGGCNNAAKGHDSSILGGADVTVTGEAACHPQC